MKKKGAFLLYLFIALTFGYFLIDSPFRVERINLTHKSSVMKGVRVKRITDSGLRWLANVREVFFKERQEVAYLKDVSLYYPDRDFYLSSDRGVYNIKKGTIKLKNSVRGRTDKMEFETERLKYNPEKGTITSDTEVLIKGERLTITGSKARVREDKRLEVEGDVRTVFK
ncbi:MAG: LPS export ABC transporter periplasmic protein LptC [Nitrospirae bacterium]|nr:MAG: LPS export ABC transporter periplasmic protein LptC [Nitrospirota bacterium]